MGLALIQRGNRGWRFSTWRNTRAPGAGIGLALIQRENMGLAIFYLEEYAGSRGRYGVGLYSAGK
jgi:hypothetical protein